MAERRSRSRNRDLAWEFRQFSGLSKHLKKIIYDSNVSLAELRTCGHFEDGKGEEMQKFVYVFYVLYEFFWCW